jgi:DNA (cytosine-5)-methyltransferase 1
MQAVRYLSVCSGIEAATVAWHPLGWMPAAFSEIEAFPRAVLAHHYPEVPLHGDFTTIGADDYGPIDLLVGGTPCQSFSVAGLRGGLADKRGGLALEFLKLADRKGARWLVWENVPGVLSSNGGRDFGSFLGGLVELGYGFAYRVLDAQHFGVPQRRRRVFVVGHLGDWRCAAAVLFERHSLSGHPTPRREKGQAAPTIPSRSSAGGGLGTDFDCDGGLIASTGDTAHCLNAGGMGRQDYETETLIAHSLRAEGFDASEDGTGRGTPLVPVWSVTQDSCPVAMEEMSPSLKIGTGLDMGQPPCIAFTAKDHGADAQTDLSPTLRAGGHSTSHANAGVMPAVAFSENQQANITEHEIMPSLKSGGGKPGQSYPAIRQASAVRRLTPVECERLQGFPDDYTLVPYRNKPAADGPRYKALGNSMAVPCMVWLGQRIQRVEDLCKEQRDAA